MLGLLLGAALLAPAAARAQYAVTIAARSCPSYEAITANLARNDIQESLRDLGPDSPYRRGQPIDPQLEAQGQSSCEPLPSWRFTFGRDYVTQAVSGQWGSLSIVARTFDTEIVTRPSTPLLDTTGVPTGRTIAGAVTIELTQAQLDQASRHDLWLQGGTPTDPVLDQVYPDRYGFGALRCAIDNLNGDNVEWIAFPEGTRHVFCFAYYVTPPPTSGAIVVRKEVEAPADLAAHDFGFDGDLSYNPGGAFALTAAPGRPASATFYRAAGDTPWTVREVVEPGWELLGIACDSRTGASSAAIPAESAIAQVRLAAGDVVTCTYRNGLAPPPSGLTVGKVTRGAAGAADFRITGPALSAETRLTTPAPDTAAYEHLLNVPPGAYTIRETPVPLPGGDWDRIAVRCNGRIVSPATDPLSIAVPPGAGVVCLFLNDFAPAGAIRLRKDMLGATGTTAFTIRPLDADPPVVYQQRAVVSRRNVAAVAVGDPTTRIPLGTYDIQETTPSGREDWRLESVVCNGVPVGSAQGRIRIRLTPDEPEMTCTFADRITRPRPGEVPPGDDGPGGGRRPGARAADPSPQTNLQVTKRVRPSVVVSGRPVRYTVVVRNAGRATARDVVIAELQPPSHRRVDVEAPQGVRCRGTRPLRCVIGDLEPGRRVVLGATYTTPLRGRVVNRVAVHTATHETRLGDNRAVAALRVVPARPPGACASSFLRRC